MADQYMIDGSGELIRYSDPYAAVSEDMVTRFQEVEAEILQRVGLIEANYLHLGRLLSEVKEKKLYLASSLPTFHAWCESPNLSRIGYRSAQRLIQIVNEALPVLEKHDAMDLVPALGMSTMADLLPILNDENGEEKFIEAANEVKDMTNRDAKIAIKALRSGEEEPLERDKPTVFKAKVKLGEEFHRVEVYADSGIDYYKVGTLMIKRRDWSRWEARFGAFVQIEDE